MLLRATAASGVGQMPVPVTVGGVALLAESRVVVQASRVHLLEAVRPPERLDDDLRAVGADRIADPGECADRVSSCSLWSAVLKGMNGVSNVVAQAIEFLLSFRDTVRVGPCLSRRELGVGDRGS